MRIVVTGGGTGGHIFPALEIVKELKRNNDKMEVIFVGNLNSLEQKMTKGAHIPFYGLSAKQIVGQSFSNKLIALIFLKIAIFKSIWFLVKKRPSAVIGVGGYISVPMMVASFLLGIPRYLCEQNVVPGMANKYLALIAKKVFISFLESRQYFPKDKVVHSGNPVRSVFFTLPAKEPSGSFRILITGGSLGAQFLNREIPKVMGLIGPLLKNLEITHQTGENVQEEVIKAYGNEHISAQVVSFIDNMPKAFLEHDLLISRAGATVCAEIMASGMPAILIPYPFANGHQKYNAQALVKAGAAIMIDQDEHFSESLALNLKNLYGDPTMLYQMGKKAKNMAAAKAAFVIVSTVLNER